MGEIQVPDGTLPRPRTVPVNGAKIAVFEFGLEPGPRVQTVLLMHGFPDDHRLWSPLIGELAEDFHLVAYDSRNAGKSWVTVGGLAPFVIEHLVDDVYAVLDSVGVDKAHIVAHDWGSVQAWSAVRDERAPKRVQSLLSISGPDLRHYRHWLKRALSNRQTRLQGLGQLAKSWYILFFQLPKLSEIMLPKVISGLRTGVQEDGLGTNAARGLALYRANTGIRKVRTSEFLPAARAKLQRSTKVPALLVQPIQDRFVSVDLAQGVHEWAPHTDTLPVHGGHWWPASHAPELARITKDWIGSHSAAADVA